MSQPAPPGNGQSPAALGVLAYSSTHRTTMQEHNGWWRHVGFGLFIFRRKANPGWIYP